MAVECGATCGMMMVDSETISYFWPILKKEFENRSDAWFHLKQRWNSDPNCQYDQIIEIDLTTIRPLIAKGYSPADVTEVSELAGQKINQVLIGSCTNGRLDDLRVAAQIFKTTCIIINPKVRCIIAPATQEIYLQALKEGLIETFITAGCCVTNPSCGACLGMSNGVLAPGEICLSTTNRNFRDRMGEGGVIFLASPQTAAASAITGSITVPPLGEKFYQRSSKPACVLPSGYNKNVNFKAVNYKALLSKISSRTKLEGDIVSEVFFFPGSTKDNIDTDQIIPAKYLNEKNKAVFGKHCFEAVPNFSLDLLEGKVIIIAGEDFGCGSSREQAVYALEAIGIKCVIAESFARIFYNNMFNNGLLCVELGKDIVSKLKEKAESGKFPDVGWKEITVLWDTPVGQPGYIFPTSSALANEKLTFKISERQKEYIRAGGAMPYMIKLAAEIFN
jgi:3-isopropylmalate dehydratase small subunit